MVFNRVYRLEIQSVMLVFSTPLLYCCPSTFSLTSPPSPLPKAVAVGVGEGGVLICVVDHILQEFNTLFWQDSEPSKLLHHPKQKWPVKTTFRDCCLKSSFVHASAPTKLVFQNGCCNFDAHILPELCSGHHYKPLGTYCMWYVSMARHLF
jgi:hypothetical protein